MKQRDIKKYLYDIAEACQHLESFTAGKTFEDYEQDVMLRSAVERQFEIIGEALRQAIEIEVTLRDRISNAPRIIGFRNRLIHGYASVADEVVWGVLEASLPTLKHEVKSLLQEMCGIQ